MKRFIFLMLTGLSFNSSAHDYSGVLPAEASAVDFLGVSCNADGDMVPDKMYFKISSPDTTPLISAQIAKGNFVTNMTPNRGGVEIYQGEGLYRVTVDKNGTGVASYSIEYHCESGGDHTETTITHY
ncbi:MAG: hypothetical protein PHN45_05510 [Methylococcales bacterium]|nr:hypothetical protein [Methylococcales bacterium]MDD5754193.1 hypothetical protein [Methylococcales bacterium]